MHTVCTYGDPVLRKNAGVVELFDRKLEEFVTEMIDVMYEYDGVGLAAPQIAVSRRIAVIDPTGGEMEQPFIFINPEIIYLSEELTDYDEGCLSVPDITIKIQRPSFVSVCAYNLRGEMFEINNVDGLLARAIQHEVDHLNGILFVDRASVIKRQMVSGKLKKLAKLYKKPKK